MKAFSELTSASQVNNSDLLAISQASGNDYASKKTTVKDVTDKANLNLAEEYDSTSTYAVGSYVMYESVLYKCTASTTGSFDPTKWTQVVIVDEMGSGGGGGTGGHTIIDENGTSMTARAGLQFVGGANVSDDSTNNRTIVDLASAGGIDGVFIDTTNTIYQETFRTSISYTATEDCFVHFYVPTTSAGTLINIDSHNVIAYNSTNYVGDICPLKKGQVLSISGCDSARDAVIDIIGIQIGTTHSKFQPVIYSTEEREIGVWTDGKPLYEKTFLFDYNDLQNETYGKYINLSIPNIDKSCLFSISIEDGQLILPYYQGADLYIIAFPTLSTDVCKFSFRYGSAVSSQISAFFTNCKIILRYTKTTDTAGSGTWTPQGVPAVHYSMDEHIIGTWVDGSTLYEKTILINNGGNISTGDNQFAHNISNFGRIINAHGTSLRGTGSSEKSMVIPYASGDSNSNWDIGIYEFDETYGYVKVGNSYTGQFVLSNCYVTLQYTKS